MSISILQSKFPSEVLMGCIPNYHFFYVFEYLCWPNLHPYNKHNLDFCSSPCVFLDYNPNHKEYLSLHILSDRVYISRDVLFDESIFCFKSKFGPPTYLNYFPAKPYASGALSA